MIDPLAGPWTVGRSRKRGRRRLAKISPTRGGSLLELHTEHEDGAQDAPHPRAEATGPSSYLDAKPPHLTRSPRTRQLAASRWLRYRVAGPLLALLIVAGLALTSAIVVLVGAGLSGATGAPAASVPLAVPAPEMAGGMPRHELPLHNAAIHALIAEFTSRFAAVAGSQAGQPAALYREPGAVDPATGEPAWVMYLGQNSATTLGPPGATISRMMTALTGTSAPDSFWPVATGPFGGSARCAIARFGATSVSLCAWATPNTIGALMSPTADTRGNELATLMPLMRADLQPG
ncbi:MAG TPA: hypothetical protein VN695_18930 [Streptosporangiaceae bacterium]|nr:hypothetical protein [Streptosporangiaceae bacterium]